MIASAVIAVASGFFSAPDVTTRVATAAFLFVLIFILVFACIRSLDVASWPRGRQWAFIWFVTVGMGTLSLLLPLLMKLLFGGV
jgi:hypothetical protein